MTPQGCLIKICKIQSKLIKEFTDIDYFDKRDYKDISTWSNTICEKIIEMIAKNNAFTGTDASISPFCIFDALASEYLRNNYYRCLYCSYSKRHGSCCAISLKTSLYETVVNKLETLIIDIPGISYSVRDIAEKYVK